MERMVAGCRTSTCADDTGHKRAWSVVAAEREWTREEGGIGVGPEKRHIFSYASLERLAERSILATATLEWPLARVCIVSADGQSRGNIEPTRSSVSNEVLISIEALAADVTLRKISCQVGSVISSLPVSRA